MGDARLRCKPELHMMRTRQRTMNSPGRISNNLKTWHAAAMTSKATAFDRLWCQQQQSELAAELALTGVQMVPPLSRHRIVGMHSRPMRNARPEEKELSSDGCYGIKGTSSSNDKDEKKKEKKKRKK